MKRIQIYHIALIVSIITIGWSFSYEYLTNADITGNVYFEKHWQCESILSPPIDTNYGLYLNVDIISTGRVLNADLVYTIQDLATAKIQSKRLLIHSQNDSSGCVIDGVDPFFFNVKKNGKYRLKISVQNSTLEPSKVKASYKMDMDYMDVMNHNNIKYCVFSLGILFFLVSILLGISNIKRN